MRLPRRRRSVPERIADSAQGLVTTAAHRAGELPGVKRGIAAAGALAAVVAGSAAVSAKRRGADDPDAA